MKKEEIAEIAFKKKELPSTCNLAEKHFYLQLYYLYRDYRSGLIDKEKAEENKKRFEKEFKENQDKIDKYYEVFKNQNKLRGEIHEYLVNLEKSETEGKLLDNSLILIEKIIQDKSFYDRQIKKIDNENKI